MKILIIGAGIIGLTTAYQLVKRGFHVLVLEREADLGRVSSYMNGGQFSFSYAEPLANPAMPRQLPAILFGRYAALKIKPAAFPKLLPWGLRFLQNCNAEDYTQNTKNVLSLAQVSREEMGRYLSEQTADFNFRATGKLHIYRDSIELQRITPLVELKNSLGFAQEIWNSEMCLQREPALKHYQGPFAGGVFSPLDQSGDTYKLIQALKNSCLQTGRCEIRTQVDVRGFNIEQGLVSSVASANEKFSADGYVVCAGVASARLLRTAGIGLPIIPVKGYSITVPAFSRAPEINLTDTQKKIVFTRLGTELRVAGLMEFTGQNLQTPKKTVAHLLRLASSTLPQAGDYTQLNACWAGLRPMTPDNVPVIGPTRWRNLWLNAGHGMLGSTLAFGSARLIADLLSGTKNPLDDTSFDLGRFEKS